MRTCILTLLLFQYAVTLNAQNTIELINGEWPPFQSQNLPHFGFASHVVSEAFNKEGIKVKYVFRPWGRAAHDVKIGKAIGSIVWTKTENRKKFAWFSQPVITLDEVIYYRVDNQLQWDLPNDLYGLSFTVPLGSTLGSWQVHEGQDKINFIRSTDVKHGFLLLLKKRVDGFPYNKMVGDYILRMEYPDKKEHLTYSKGITSKSDYRLMLSNKFPKNKKILEKFNQGISSLLHSEKYKKMMNSFNKGEYDSVK